MVLLSLNFAIAVFSSELLVFAQDGASQGKPCPANVSEWGRWRDTALSGLSNINGLRERVQEAKECIGGLALPDALNSDKQLQACLSPMLDFVSAVETFHDNEKMMDEYYVPERLDFPEMMRLPEFFKDKAFRRAFTSETATDGDVAVQIARFKRKFPKALLVSFTSRFICGETYIALLPGNAFDQWVHFEKRKKECDSSTHQPTLPEGTFLSASIQKQGKSGQPLSRPRSYYNVFVELGDDKKTVLEGAHQEKMIRQSGGDQINCFQCHRTGAVSLIPDPRKPVIAHATAGGARGMNIVLEMNKRIEETANALPADFAVQSRLGPMMGEVDPPARTEEFIRRCAKADGLDASSIKKIKEAMNCAGCHNDSEAGAWRYPMGTGKTKPVEILEQFIFSGHMPPGAAVLSLGERQAVFSCLMAEYYGGFNELVPGARHTEGALIRSLKENPCPASDNGLSHREKKSTQATPVQ